MRFALQQLRETLQARFPAACSLKLPAGVLPTGEPRLDELLPGGGLPRGCLVELEGAPSSGKSELIDRLTATVTVGGGYRAYVDLPGTYYPPAAAAAGACLSRVLVVRPAALPQAIWACELLTRCQAFELIVADLTLWPAPRLGAAPLHRLARVAEQGQGVVLFVTEPPAGTTGERVLPGSVTATRLVAERRAGVNDIRLERSSFRGPGARKAGRPSSVELIPLAGALPPVPRQDPSRALDPAWNGTIDESKARSLQPGLLFNRKSHTSAGTASPEALALDTRRGLSPMRESHSLPDPGVGSTPGRGLGAAPPTGDFSTANVIPLQPHLERQSHDGRRR